MADALLKLPDDSANTGKQLDTTSLTVAAQTVHRERMTVAGATDVALAAVLNAAPTTDYGLVVRAAGTALVRENDGTNSETTLFDLDSGGGAQYAQGVSIRKAASGGSVEYGTSTDPLRTDPTGTTTQPVSGTVTANLSATDNAVLDTIATPVATIGATPLQRVAIFDAADAQITSFGGGTQYTEDAAAAADPVGNATILVRKDAPATITSLDGDNVAQRGTNYGAAFVQVVSSAGALIDSFGGSGGTAQADESAFTEGTTTMTPIGGVLNDTIVSDPTEDQAAAVRITAKRALHVNLRNVAGTEITTFPTTGVAQVDASGGTDTNVGYDTGNLNMPTQDVAGIIDDAAFTPATSAIQMVGFEFDDASPDSVNEGDGGAARMSANRNIYTNIRDNAGNERGLNVDTNGEIGIGAIRTSVTPGTAAANLGKAEDVAHASGDVGVYALAVRDDTPAAHSGTDGDYESLHVNADGGLWVSSIPCTTGGLTIFRSLDLDETEEEVKATAGCVFSLWFTNTATSTRWLKFYNATAANVTVGTTTPVLTIGLPGNASDDISGMFGGAYGWMFGTAITVAATTGVADADTGAPGANDVIVNIGYR